MIDAVLPAVDGGRFPAKRIVGEAVEIEAHCFTDGHDQLRVRLHWQAIGTDEEYEVDMQPRANDVWLAEFTPARAGRYRYTVMAWVDHFESWRRELERRDDSADIRVALQVGGALIDEAVERVRGGDAAVRARGRDAAVRAKGGDAAVRAKGGDAAGRTPLADAAVLTRGLDVALRVQGGDAAVRTQNGDAAILAEWAVQLRAAAEETHGDPSALKAMALDAARAAIVARYPDRSLASTLALELVADRRRAGFSTWYEMFPRSAGTEPGRHGTFKDVEARLPYLADMGFDVLYFPPIHPIGRINRKGTNNTLTAKPGDVGSPWAIGAAEGGHKDILPLLGTLEDFRHLLGRSRELGIEIALDIAFQCAPDHPYVEAHPQWFRHRPDGSVQYAENPPKKYQDIYPFDFETDDWRALWQELKSIVDFWIAQGVRIFRVDNPHTKAFAFWEWMIEAVKSEYPDVIFLAEAFTRPKLMHRLAKLGFSQSYTYFTWRNTKQELTDYFTDLASGPGRQYYRPNVWPNTPDILPETLQSGLRPVFAARLVLAATLAANYGIYGPTYELLESAAREPGSEEYRDSEKYQLRHWTLDSSNSLWSLAARMNRIRRENIALQSDRGLRFCPVDNDQLIAYLKTDAACGNVILTVVNPGSSPAPVGLGGRGRRRVANRGRTTLPGARSAERAALYLAGPA